MHNLTKLANTIMQILDREPRDNKLTEYELLSKVREQGARAQTYSGYMANG